MRDSEAGNPQRQEAARLDHWHGRCISWVMVSKRSIDMLQLAMLFLAIALVAAVFGLSGLVGAATNIVWLLFAVGVAMALLFFLTSQRSH